MLKFGEVYWLDLTKHTSPSKSTMKSSHPVVVIQNEKLFSNKYDNVIVLPATSFRKNKHWDEDTQNLEYTFHYLLKTDSYPKLRNDTVIKCEQIFTISSKFFTEPLFTLRNDDMRNILMKVALVLGFNRIR